MSMEGRLDWFPSMTEEMKHGWVVSSQHGQEIARIA